MRARGGLAGHAFISYVREDSRRVDELQRTLEAAGVPVWRDTADLWPGEDWRAKIRSAITDNALVFIACFSQASRACGMSYQNEELTLAIEQLRLRRQMRCGSFRSGSMSARSRAATSGLAGP